MNGVRMDKAARGFLWDNLLCMPVYWASAGTVIAALADYYALPLALTNFITGLTSTLLIVQIWGGARYARTRNRARFLGVSNSLWRILLPLVFFTVFLPYNVGKYAAIGLFFLAVSIFQFSCPAQTDWMVGSVEGKVGANYYAIREMYYNLAFVAVFCVVSLLLDTAQREGGMAWAFVAVGVVFSLLAAASLVTLARLPYPQDRPAERVKKEPVFSIAFSNGSFRGVVLTNALWSFACIFVGSFSAVYQVGVLHLRFFQIMLWTTAANLLRAVFTPVMAALAGRFGWRRVLCGCMLLYGAAALLWSRIIPENAPMLYPVVCILNAIPFAGIGVGFLQLQVDAAPPQHRSACFSVFYACSGVGAMAGTLVCSGLVRLLEAGEGAISTVGLCGVFLVGAVFICISAVSVLRIPAGNSPQ